MRHVNRLMKRASGGLQGCLFFLILTCLLLSADPACGSGEKAPITKILKLEQKWTGDFDGMAERRYIRVLVTYSKTNYFLDGFH